MTYYSILTIVVGLFIAGEIYFLGKYLQRTSNIFAFNGAAALSMGAVLYFVITFFTFFMFVWINPSISYYLVIFVIKESIQVIFLFLRRGVFSEMKINWYGLGFTALSIIVFPIAFNYGLADSLNLSTIVQSNDFQTWGLYQEVISELTKMDVVYITKWFASAIASMVIYNIVASFMISFSKRKNWFDYLISFFLTLGLILLFNFGQSLDSLIGIFLLLFAIQLSIQILTKSRRRFAVILGLLDITIWFFQPELFLGILILSAVIAIIYTFLRKNKASLFWVQLVSPILLMSSLWLYPVTGWGALFLVIVSIFLYIFMIGIGRLEMLDKFNITIDMARFALPIIALASIIITAIAIGVASSNSPSDYMLFNNAIWESYNNDLWNEIQSYLYYAFVGMFIIWVAIMLHKKKTIKGYWLVLIISATFIMFAYNPAIRIITKDTNMDNQFQYLRIIAFMPLTLLIPILLRRQVNTKGEIYG